ncbi:MAG: PD40 domain-containing protein [Thermoplasmata archaeon]|nr:PD40 domain-containing protein [Thermoplasmata archaeon]
MIEYNSTLKLVMRSSLQISIFASVVKWLLIFFILLAACAKEEQINVLAEAVSFDWSPNSRSIAFVNHNLSLVDLQQGKKHYHRQLYVKDIYRREDNTKLIIGNDTCLYDLDWSPNGEILAVDRRIGNTKSHIWLYPIDRCSPPLQLTNDVFNDWAPRFSPDGQMIAFESDRCGKRILVICVMSITERDIKVLTFGTKPDWHPNGKSIIYTAFNENTRFDIQSINLETGDTQSVVNSCADEYWASYSPDGHYILYLRYDETDLFIWVKDLETNKEFRFTDIIPVSVHPPRWSPDGKKIAFFISAGEDKMNTKLIWLPFNPAQFTLEE